MKIVIGPVTRNGVYICSSVASMTLSLLRVVTVNNITSTYQLKNDYLESFAAFNHTTQ